jgi:hypothetical protein
MAKKRIKGLTLREILAKQAREMAEEFAFRDGMKSHVPVAQNSTQLMLRRREAKRKNYLSEQ